jgi:hypothetical protein
MTIIQAIEFLPDAPPYVAGEAGWGSLEYVQSLVRVSPSGLQKMRKRFKNSFEHRDSRGGVMIYTPYWLRVWKVDQQTQ